MRSGSLEKASVDEPWAGHRFLGSMSQLAGAAEERIHSKGSSGLASWRGATCGRTGHPPGAPCLGLVLGSSRLELLNDFIFELVILSLNWGDGVCAGAGASAVPRFCLLPPSCLPRVGSQPLSA